jgi:hypothetical protein
MTEKCVNTLLHPPIFRAGRFRLANNYAFLCHQLPKRISAYPSVTFACLHGEV